MNTYDHAIKRRSEQLKKAALLQRWADYLTAPVTPLKLFKDEA